MGKESDIPFMIITQSLASGGNCPPWGLIPPDANTMWATAKGDKNGMLYLIVLHVFFDCIFTLIQFVKGVNEEEKFSLYHILLVTMIFALAFIATLCIFGVTFYDFCNDILCLLIESGVLNQNSI